MQHYGTLKTVPFRGPLYIHAKALREQLLQNNHKHGSRTKELRIKKVHKNTGPNQATITFPIPKANSD